MEIKDFDSDSPTSELEKTRGQMQLYQWALDKQEPERTLFLAVSEAVYHRIFQRPLFQLAVERNRLNLLVLDETKEEIWQWIKATVTQTS